MNIIIIIIIQTRSTVWNKAVHSLNPSKMKFRCQERCASDRRGKVNDRCKEPGQGRRGWEENGEGRVYKEVVVEDSTYDVTKLHQGFRGMYCLHLQG
jgi:hypothetical protein